MTLQESYEIVHENCGSLLFTSATGEAPALISKMDAAKLLGRISHHVEGLGGSGSYQIPQQAVREARLDLARWEKATAAGLLVKHGEEGNVTYELPVLLKMGNDIVPTTLIASLQSISDLDHDHARRIATKHAAKLPGTGEHRR